MESVQECPIRTRVEIGGRSESCRELPDESGWHGGMQHGGSEDKDVWVSSRYISEIGLTRFMWWSGFMSVCGLQIKMIPRFLPRWWYRFLDGDPEGAGWDSSGENWGFWCGHAHVKLFPELPLLRSMKTPGKPPRKSNKTAAVNNNWNVWVYALYLTGEPTLVSRDFFCVCVSACTNLVYTSALEFH